MTAAAERMPALEHCALAVAADFAPLFDAITPIGDRYRVARRYGLDTKLEVSRMGPVAVVRLDGIATRRPDPSQAWLSGFATELIPPLMDELAKDEAVTAVVLWIDSPGGAASGIEEAVAAIERLDAVKPVVAQVQGVAASAAYWLATGARKIYLHDSDQVGSIGVIARVMDSSAAYQAAGLKPFTATTGPLKAMGLPGEPLTDAQKAYVQEHVDGIYAAFKAQIVSGRGLSAEAVDGVAHGGVFNASEALALGLADGVQDLDTTLAQLRGTGTKAKPSNPPRSKAMNQSDAVATVPGPATFQELRTALPMASAEFLVECQSENRTLDQATGAFLAQQVKENAELKQQLAAEAAKVAPAAKAPGVDDTVVAERRAGEGRTSGDFLAQVTKLVDAGMTRANAVLTVADRDQAGYLAYVQQHQDTNA